jgi:hypothetical protein
VVNSRYGCEKKKTAKVGDVAKRLTSLESQPAFIGGGNLTSMMILNTGGFIADGKQHVEFWKPPRTIRIKSSRVWIGVELGKKCDVLGYIIRNSDYSYVNPWGWDHYADPSSPHFSDKSFGNDYMEVTKDDSLQLIYQCVPAVPNDSQFRAHVAMWIWYL